MIMYEKKLREYFDGIIIDKEVKCAGHKNNSKSNFKIIKGMNYSSTLEVNNIDKEIIVKTNVNKILSVIDSGIFNYGYKATLLIGENGVTVTRLLTNIKINVVRENKAVYLFVRYMNIAKFAIKIKDGIVSTVNILDNEISFDYLLGSATDFSFDLTLGFLLESSKVNMYKEIYENLDEIQTIFEIMCNDKIVATCNYSKKPFGKYKLLREEYDDYGNFELVYSKDGAIDETVAELIYVNNKGIIQEDHCVIKDRQDNCCIRLNEIRY